MPSALIYFTIYLAVGLYGVSLLAQLAGRRALGQMAWMAGCAILFVHVGLALHFVYHWDHALLVRETARQTAQRTGSSSGIEVYISYAFMAVWAFDAAWWRWAGDERYRRRPVWIGGIVHLFMMFIVFNAVVIFAGTAWTRWVGMAGFGVIGVAALGVVVRRVRLRALDRLG